MKNIFLTGQVKIGKSTIVNAVLADISVTVKGFRTLPYYKKNIREGFVIRGINDSGLKLRNSMENFLICRRSQEGKMVSLTKNFETMGAFFLQESLESSPALIVMDELGTFESEALNFQEKVLECLTAEVPVLGVIKNKKSPFLDSIREREDVVLLHVYEKNRETLVKTVKEALESASKYV